MLPQDIIIPFDGNHADIPDGFERDTRFDGLYVKITTSDWGNTGGNATHTHTSPSHAHTYSVNGHTHTTGNVTGNVASVGGGSHRDAPPYDVTTTAHIHASATSGVMASASITPATMTVNPANNEYSKYDLIFLKSLKWNRFPINSLVMKNDTNSREKASHFDSLNGRYMKGAGTGQNAGNPTDVASHVHGTSHSHTLTHGHGATSTGNTTGGDLGADNISGGMADHGHTITFVDHSEVVSNSDNTPSAVSQLAYQELHFWKFSEQAFIKEGDIALFIGADLPRGWNDLGYSDLYVKGKTSGQPLTSGGSNTHSHSAMTHSHTGSSHTHTWNTNTVGANGKYRGGGTPMAGTHYHTGTTSAATNSSTGSSDATIDSANCEPPFIKVRLIQATKQALTGGGGAAQSHLT